VALPGRVRLPFLTDFAAPARFLLALPLMLWAEGVMAGRFRDAARQFVAADLIPDSQRPAFLAACRLAVSRRDSRLAEAIILVISYLGSLAALLAPSKAAEEFAVSSWRSLTGGGGTITLAGWWYLLFAAPFFRFLLFRWIWRFSIWVRFLRQAARLDLKVMPTHPDLAGGLGFLGRVQLGFGLVVFAISTVFSAQLAQLVVHRGVPLAGFSVLIGTLIVLLAAAVTLPLAVFSPRLIAARYHGTMEYGALVSQHHRAFDEKWVRRAPDSGGGLLGDPDASSLADTPSGFLNVQQMRPLPLARLDGLGLVAAAAVPFVPLLLTQLSLQELLSRLVQLFL
jgi:hypothetical protein